AVGKAMPGVFYVFDGIYDEFVRRVAAKARALRQGPPTHDRGGDFDVGAITMPRQLELIGRQLDDAVAKGARVLVGGRRNPTLPGQFFEPTVIVDVDHTMAIVHEEAFGPVMIIVRVRDEDEAVRLANDGAYGLGSSVFTRDKRRGHRIAHRISAGMTVINDYRFGRVSGREGLRACCSEKTVVWDKLPLRRKASFYPIKKATFPFLKNVISMIHGRGVSTKLKAAAGIAKNLWGMKS
ncbi:MAG: aldehyde dehydrogenase family protein, partial [Polyangia bacterium]